MHSYIQQYINAVAKANGTTAAGVARQFNVQPAVSQKMREAVRLQSTFLQKINIISKTEIAGSIIGLSTGLNASRTDTKNGDGSVRRQPKPYHNLSDRQYLCKKVNFDTQVSYDDMDSWSAQPEYVKLINNQLVKSKALSLIAIGFNGTSAAATTNFASNPLLQDVQKGWLQHLRENAATNVMGGAAKAIEIGTGKPYTSIDHLVTDVMENLIDEEFHDMPGMTVICHQSLLSEKYFAVIKDAGNKASELRPADIIMSEKRLGGLPVVTVPYFPKNTLLVTPLENLSIYFHKGGHRRKLVDEPEFDRIADYQSENICYVVEEYGAAALVENIKIVK